MVFRLLRELADVVLVGAGTVRAEGYGPVLLDEVAQERRATRGQQPAPPIAVVTRSLLLGADMFDELCLTVTPLVGGDPLRRVAAPRARH